MSALPHFHTFETQPEIDFLTAIETNNPTSGPHFYLVRDNNDEGFGRPYPNPTSLKWVNAVRTNNP